MEGAREGSPWKCSISGEVSGHPQASAHRWGDGEAPRREVRELGPASWAMGPPLGQVQGAITHPGNRSHFCGLFSRPRGAAVRSGGSSSRLWGLGWWGAGTCGSLPSPGRKS